MEDNKIQENTNTNSANSGVLIEQVSDSHHLVTVIPNQVGGLVYMDRDILSFDPHELELPENNFSEGSSIISRSPPSDES